MARDAGLPGHHCPGEEADHLPGLGFREGTGAGGELQAPGGCVTHVLSSLPSCSRLWSQDR